VTDGPLQQSLAPLTQTSSYATGCAWACHE